MGELNALGRATYALVLVDAFLCAAILYRVDYTEIDWRAYMQQVETFLGGERDYGGIKGQTGPLVYPAGHLYVFSALYWLSDAGRDIFTAQIAFAGLYLATLTVTIATYLRANVPLYALPLLILSKRLHSIYLLRLFNDGISAFLMAVSTYWYVRRVNILGTLFFSLAVSLKMNALLYLPAIALLLVQGIGIQKSIRHALIMLQLQVLIGSPFLLHNTPSYLTKAFEFTRTFLYKWTVNWRFLDEETFLSSKFSILLLVCHLAVLTIFASTRWTRPTGVSLGKIARLGISSTLGFLFPTGEEIETAHMTPSFILTTLYSSNLIGIVFARSLHYQFYAWFAWSMPFLLAKTGLVIPIQLGLWIAQEWAWNVYPSTPVSSAIVVGVPSVTLLAIWHSTRYEVAAPESPQPTMKKSIKKNKPH